MAPLARFPVGVLTGGPLSLRSGYRLTVYSDRLDLRPGGWDALTGPFALVAILLDRVIGKRWSFALSEITQVVVEMRATGKNHDRSLATLKLKKTPYSIAITTRDGNQVIRSLKAAGLSVGDA